MPIIVKGGGDNAGTIKHTAPKGLHHAVCVDVIDIGLKQTQWGEKQKLVVRWQIPVKDPDGNLHLVQKWYTRSLHEKAALRQDLEGWRGREFSADELKGFDVEKLIGANCQVLIVHKKGTDGKVWANVQAITPSIKGQRQLTAQGYTRATVDHETDDDEPPPVEYDDSMTSELPEDPPF